MVGDKNRRKVNFDAFIDGFFDVNYPSLNVSYNANKTKNIFYYIKLKYFSKNDYKIEGFVINGFRKEQRAINKFRGRR